MLTAAVVLFAQFKCLFIINQQQQQQNKTTWILQQAERVLTLKKKKISSKKKQKTKSTYNFRIHLLCLNILFICSFFFFPPI